MLAVESKITPAHSVAPTPIGSSSSWKQLVEPVEPFLDAVTKRLAEQVNAFDPALSQYAEYALTGNGKHLRPTLVALAANSIGKMNDSHVTVAAIIEMVHLATLVHDDVMDEAEMRRGKLTLAANWGNEIAVLFGDCLFAQALKLAASFPTPEICRAVASATNTVCSGEILQTRHRKNFELSQKEYFRVLQMKTGELFALSCDMAAFLGNATPSHRTVLREFGMAFGTAYQIYDDCVDLFGTEKQAGKSLVGIGDHAVRRQCQCAFAHLFHQHPVGQVCPAQDEQLCAGRAIDHQGVDFSPLNGPQRFPELDVLGFWHGLPLVCQGRQIEPVQHALCV